MSDLSQNLLKDTPSPIPQSDLDAIIKDSENNIKFQEAVPLKRKPGPKPGSKRRPHDSSQNTANVAPAGPSPLIEPIATVLGIPFEVAASTTGIKELIPSPDRLKGCATLAEQVIAYYMPKMSNENPGTTLIMTFAFAYGSLGFEAFMKYKAMTPETDTKKEEKDTKKAPEKIPLSQMSGDPVFPRL